MKIPSTAIIVVLGEWEALVIPVPPTASYRWKKQKVELPPKPPRPMSEYESLAGHTEIVPSLPGSDDYNRWVEAMVTWGAECEAALEDRAGEMSEFAFDYAVLAWRLAGSDEAWSKEPPKGWKPSEAYERHGVELSGNMRLEFILNELLCVKSHLDAVNAIMYPDELNPERDTSPITGEEVSAALASFQSGDEIPRATGGMGGRSRGRRGRSKHQDVESGPRVVNSQKAGHTRPRWLVWLNERFKNTYPRT